MFKRLLLHPIPLQELQLFSGEWIWDQQRYNSCWNYSICCCPSFKGRFEDPELPFQSSWQRLSDDFLILIQSFYKDFVHAVVSSKIRCLRRYVWESKMMIGTSSDTGIGSPSIDSNAIVQAAIIKRSDVAFATLCRGHYGFEKLPLDRTY